MNEVGTDQNISIRTESIFYLGFKSQVLILAFYDLSQELVFIFIKIN